MYAEELGTPPLPRAGSPLYVAVEHFKKRGMTQEFVWANKRAVANLQWRGVRVGRLFDGSTSGWKTPVEGGRVLDEEERVEIIQEEM